MHRIKEKIPADHPPDTSLPRKKKTLGDLGDRMESPPIVSAGITA
jgi:hypothetical protein